MGMTIEQIIKYLPAPICGSTVIGEEKQKEYDAHDSVIIILHKYQKITEIIKNTSGDEVYGDLYNKIYGVLEDGKID